VDIVSIELLKKRLDESNRIVVLSGAGVSTDSGIPDFRSKDGLWEEYPDHVNKMSRSYYNRRPKEFWPLYKDVFSLDTIEDYKPNSAHLFFKELEDKGKQVTILTQNVDGLHQKAGSKHVLEVHGSIRTATCPKCKTKYDLDYLLENDIPRCSKVNGKGNTCNFILKPDTVLFGDPIHHFKEGLELAYEADLFITIGTSLEVYPINEIPLTLGRAPDIYKILINRTKTKYDNCFDLILNESISDVINQLN
jgi:NAD-dependent deacetylase